LSVDVRYASKLLKKGFYMKYNVVDNVPVARFWYKGNHTHPVRRTVLVIESNKNFIRGYELRDGNMVRVASKAPIKTYNRSKIAKGVNLRNSSKRGIVSNKSTLVRRPLMDLIESGV
jgi:hypothetical protein